MRWPQNPRELAAEQDRLAAEVWTAWRPLGRYAVGAVFVCFEQAATGNGLAGDRAFAAAACGDDVAVVTGEAQADYAAGELALREGALLERAARALAALPDVLLVDASGRDHPRRCGLALHLGAVLGVPTVGVTHRPLHAEGEWPDGERGATSPLVLDGERVGYWVRTKRGTRPLAAHAAWRTGPEIAVEVLLTATEALALPSRCAVPAPPPAGCAVSRRSARREATARRARRRRGGAPAGGGCRGVGHARRRQPPATTQAAPPPRPPCPPRALTVVGSGRRIEPDGDTFIERFPSLGARVYQTVD